MNPDVLTYGRTRVVRSLPWGLMSRRGTRLLCSDGKVRSVSYLASTPDTFFSTPAAVRIGKTYVTGYMTVEEARVFPEQRAYVFRHHAKFSKLPDIAGLLPEWPSSFTPEHRALVAKAHEEGAR